MKPDEREQFRDLRGFLMAQEVKSGAGRLVGTGGFVPDFNADAAAAIKPMFRPGTKRGRFRVLDVQCPKNHRLAEVLRTGGGLVLRAEGRERLVDEQEVGGEFDVYDDEGGYSHAVSWDDIAYRRYVRNRAVQIVVWLRDYTHHDEATGAFKGVEVQCKCRTVDLGGWVLEEHIKRGTKRLRVDDRFDGLRI